MAKRKRVEMNNLYIDRSLDQMHQENLKLEVGANRAASRLRAHRARGSSIWRLPGLFSFGAKAALPE
jgi:hypothetical protein